MPADFTKQCRFVDRFWDAFRVIWEAVRGPLPSPLGVQLVKNIARYSNYGLKWCWDLHNSACGSFERHGEPAETKQVQL